MPPESMELWARRFEMKEGLSGGSLWLSGSFLPRGCQDDRAAATCFPTDRTVLDGKELWVQPRMELAWQSGRFILLRRF